jgi:D-3-phosphoglycerate dehydrogenase
MRVSRYDPFVSAERFRELGVERAETSTRCSQRADFLTLHLPLNDETRGVDRRRGDRRMRDRVRIVNAARGALVDEDALGRGAPRRQGRGRGLDVFSRSRTPARCSSSTTSSSRRTWPPRPRRPGAGPA